MKFLNRGQFQRQAFVHFIRTGEVYKYEDYLKYKKATITKYLNTKLEIKKENNTKYCKWSGGSCDACKGMEGEIFEVSNIPETHNNCSCTCNTIDEEGEETGEKLKPKVKEREKPKCARVTSGFGSRTHPVTGEKGKFHGGVDIKAPEGTPIYAVKEGFLERSKTEIDNLGNETGYGNYIRIRHSENFNEEESYTEYGHLQDLSVFGDSGSISPSKQNTFIEKGDLIGYVGNTGTSTGAHLHYARKDKNNKPIKPNDEEIKNILDSLNENCK